MSPSNAELNYLDKVKWHDLYGVDLHPVLVSNTIFGKIRARKYSYFISFIVG